jgi:hypothetical protein
MNEAGDATRAGEIDEHLRSENVRPQERPGVLDAAIDVAFRGEVHHLFEIRSGQRRRQSGRIRDVGAHEAVAAVVEHPFEILEIPGIRQCIDIDDRDVGTRREESAHVIGADESGTAGYENGCHVGAIGYDARY